MLEMINSPVSKDEIPSIVSSLRLEVSDRYIHIFNRPISLYMIYVHIRCKMKLWHFLLLIYESADVYGFRFHCVRRAQRFLSVESKNGRIQVVRNSENSITQLY